MMRLRQFKFGMNQAASGQLGNQLFQANLILQLEHSLAMKSFHGAFDGHQLFPALRRTNLLLPRTGSNFLLRSEEIRSMSWAELKGCVKEKTDKGEIVLISPGILGEYFFKCSEIDPNTFLGFNRVGRVDGNKTVSIHMRGGDFRNWDHTAILPIKYYDDAIDLVVDKFGPKVRIKVFTDDVSLPAFKHLRGKLPTAIIGSGGRYKDFIDLANSDCIVSSPSTYAFWATILGKPEVIIHSKNWVHKKIEHGDVFWRDMCLNQDITLI